MAEDQTKWGRFGCVVYLGVVRVWDCLYIKIQIAFIFGNIVTQACNDGRIIAFCLAISLEMICSDRR